MSDFKKLAQKLGVSFKDIGILEEALTHRSYINEHPKWRRPHNERLEFLGDAVLELVVTEHLFYAYPDYSEGDLTNLRAALVRTETLAEIAQSIDINGSLLLSRGEAKDTGRAREAILANAFEAIVGAVFLDQGFEACKVFVLKNVLSKLGEALPWDRVRDPKSRFQELAQEKLGITPHYVVLSEFGPDHARVFNIGAYLGDELVSQGTGSSKQEAQQKAAAEALRSRNWA